MRLAKRDFEKFQSYFLQEQNYWDIVVVCFYFYFIFIFYNPLRRLFRSTRVQNVGAERHTEFFNQIELMHLWCNG